MSVALIVLSIIRPNIASSTRNTYENTLMHAYTRAVYDRKMYVCMDRSMYVFIFLHVDAVEKSRIIIFLQVDALEKSQSRVTKDALTLEKSSSPRAALYTCVI